LSDQLGAVFAALADPTRRRMLDAILADGTTSVPRLTAQLPITRQAVAKHVAALDQAGLIERAEVSGREVHYQLRPDALHQAATWLTGADAAWERRLNRLKEVVEGKAMVRP
jgi:DNA-binding transcriptional ArsR family regulator